MVAQEQRNSGAFDNAGVYYTAAAHGWFMRFRRLPEDLPDKCSVPATSPKYLGRGVQDLLAGALCFRLADAPNRCRNHCKQGLLFLEDLLEHDELVQESDEQPRIGLLHEMIGDLRLFGDLNTHDNAYAVAEEYYENVDSQRGWQAEPEFDSLVRILVELAESADCNFEEKTKRRILHDSLTARIEFKREHYPTIIENVLTDGNWYSEEV